jgi:uncharacterized membrane protein
MQKGRLEAFTDGVIAIIITIMVLELKVPQGGDLAAVSSTIPVFLAYVLSFTNVGLVWNNHHHVLHATKRINGAVLWANLFLLFWLSLVPFTIRWMDEAHFSSLPTASYGIVLAMVSVGYIFLERTIVGCNGPDSPLARAVGRDWNRQISAGGQSEVSGTEPTDRFVLFGRPSPRAGTVLTRYQRHHFG